jgi:uncharacterized membrane protein YphA (DoxX/SURF4 family)
MTTNSHSAVLNRTQSVPPATPAGAWGLLVLRVTTGLLLCYFHGWHKLLGAIEHLIYGHPWKLLEEVAELHLPAPLISALAATAAQLGCAALLIPGWFTRVNALLLAGVLSMALLQNLLAGRDPQLAALYLINLVALTLLGGGRFSLDAVLSQPLPVRAALRRTIQP